MKNIAICYSEHAIKVSDSYCSGHSNRASNPTPSIQNAVTCIYKAKLSTDKQFFIKLTWSKNLLNQGFSISVCDCPFSSSKFTKNSGVLSKARGVKCFEFCDSRVEVIWDLYQARYGTGPEPVSGFYVVVLVNSELTLILGDLGQELEIKKRVSNLKISEFSLISRCERFSGNNSVLSTRAKFCDTAPFHDIEIKYVEQNRTAEKRLSVYIDKKSVIEVKRLQWNFRGNQIIFLDGLLVDLMWDVHDWFFGPIKGCGGVFMFRTRSGLDSRLWFEENKIQQNNGDEKIGFSLLICACKNPD